MSWCSNSVVGYSVEYWCALYFIVCQVVLSFLVVIESLSLSFIIRALVLIFTGDRWPVLHVLLLVHWPAAEKRNVITYKKKLNRVSDCIYIYIYILISAWQSHWLFWHSIVNSLGYKSMLLDLHVTGEKLWFLCLYVTSALTLCFFNWFIFIWFHLSFLWA